MVEIARWKSGERVNKSSVLLKIGGSCLAAFLTQPPPVSTELAGQSVANLTVICLTEQPAIVEGESVMLRAWASTPDGEPLSGPIAFQWQATEGRIESQASQTRWDLSGVKVQPGEGRKNVIATVSATAPGGSEARCAVEVFIGKQGTAPPDRGTIRGENLFSAKRYLLPGESEEPGYGLYSYLLFSAPPQDDEMKARYLKTIEACLLILQDMDEYLKRHVRPSRLNATYIPLKTAAKPGNSNAESAANVLAVYDYTTAQILLGELDKSYSQGPYLISVLKPLSETQTPTYLFEELTGVVPELASDRIKFFSYLAAQQRSWSEETLERFTLKLRNLIAVGGKVAPDTLRGLSRMIQFKRGA